MKLKDILLVIKKSKLKKYKLKIILSLFLNKYVSKKLSSFIRRFKIGKNLKNVQIIDIIDYKTLILDDITRSNLNFVIDNYLEHRFDLLGSGWIKVDYYSEPLGVLGIKYPNRKLDKSNNNYLYKTVVHNKKKNKYKRYSSLFCASYELIDWNRDSKTGYFWNPNKKTYKQFNASNLEKNPLGVDPKFPWELSRMYHLTQFAIMAISNPEKRMTLLTEFKSQVVDFYLFNPRGYGINWASAMECSIRVSNVLFAYDIFRQMDSNNILDEKFNKMIKEFINDHYTFITNNLEWFPKSKYNANHYLSNLVGLIVVMSYIPYNRNERLFNDIVEEFFHEIKHQYQEDGSNFEGSTSYHRLSTEMIVFCISLLIRQNYFIPSDVSSIINRSKKFILSITKHNGEIVQIGDNDSGRFIKLSPIGNYFEINHYLKNNINIKNYKEMYHDSVVWGENDLKHSYLVSAINALYDDEIKNDNCYNYKLEFSFIKAIIGKKTLSITNDYRMDNIPIINNYYNDHCHYLQSIKIVFQEKIVPITTIDLFENIGLVIMKSSNLFLSINFGKQTSKEANSHIHDDLLSFELQYNSKDLIVDPGTFSYTGFKEWRQILRSSNAHNGPRYVYYKSKEENIFDYRLDYDTQIMILNSSHVIIKMVQLNKIHYREFKVNDFSLEINDYGSDKFTTNLFYDYYSSGYGKLCKNNTSIFSEAIIEVKREGF